MADHAELQMIGTYHCDFPTKFGLPRQSGLAGEVRGYLTFAPQFRDRNFFRGLEEYSHLWLLWQFSEAKETSGATVRPPKLGGNERRGVFATRSPFRPNRIGLSVVRLEKLEFSEGEPLLFVRGGDLMDGTPIFDIKPYLPYADSVPEATGGFAVPAGEAELEVVVPAELREKLPEERLPALLQILRLDPRPGYQHDDARIYRFPYAGFEIAFRVKDSVLTVTEILPPNG